MGRVIGSSLPNGTNPFPRLNDSATVPSVRSGCQALTMNSCAYVWGWRRSTKPSPHDPGDSSPSGMVTPSTLSIPMAVR